MVIPGNKGQSVGFINTASDFSQFFKPQQTQPVINQSKQENFQQTLIPKTEEPIQIQQKSLYFTPTPVVITSSSRSPIPEKSKTQEPIPEKSETQEPIEVQQKSSYFTPTPVMITSSSRSTIPETPETENQTNKYSSSFKTKTSLENKTNLTPELIKTDSVNRAEFNTYDIFQKNKEIITLQEKAKQTENKKAPPMSAPTIVNNYNNSDSSAPMNTNYKDPLENLKMQYRSYPAWRSQIG